MYSWVVMESTSLRKLSLHIDSMSCSHCLNAVREALTAARGVRVESVQMGRAVVSYDDTLTDPSRIEAAIADAGYPARASAE